MKAATTATGRPKLGGTMEVLAEDGSWLRVETTAVGDSKPDQHGQRRILLMIRFSDGEVSDWIWWDQLTWRVVA